MYENIPEPESQEASSRHPSPEQLLLREALKRFTPKQKKIWEFHNYDRLTQDEIALKMKTSRQVIARHIKACEKKITKYVSMFKGFSNALNQYIQIKADE